ncbi:MAG: hypothetical protein DRP11_00175 [Candidatus Aenigmatarchaeota archaeon]|nr:MAG: hypothetical protein DRP11_00175 [Candidatus Aenigmarchaeota archaeon]
MNSRAWVLFIVIWFLTSSYIIASTQKSFVLDPDSPLFTFEEVSFNDSVTHEFDFNHLNGTVNVTYFVEIPKNSSVMNVSFLLTGKIVPIYTKFVTSRGLLGISIGDVSYGSENEIVTGTYTLEPKVRSLFGENGSEIWVHTLPNSNKNVFSTDIGNLTNDPGNEVAVGSQDSYVYVLNSEDSSSSQAWNYSTGGEVRSVSVGDLNGGENEVVAGSLDGMVYALDSSGNLIWNFTVDSGGVYSVKIGNLTSDSGNEVAVGADKLYILNSTGGLIWKKDLGTTIYSVDIGDVNDYEGNEVVLGALDDKVYLINISESDGYVAWSYTTGDDVQTVIIGDVTDNPGNEVVAGSDDGFFYTLDENGNLIWSYRTESLIRSVASGDITGDQGNEVAGGSVDGYLYVFNFDYFPTNVSIDVGEDGDYEWSDTGKLRTSKEANGSSLVSGFQEYLDSCTPVSGLCQVPVRFHSDWTGRLNVSVNVTYRYNISSLLNVEMVNQWSRINNIYVNESVGNRSKQISFLDNPVYSIDVRYIRVNQSATSADFNRSICSLTTVNGEKVCDNSDFTIPSSGTLPSSVLVWDDTLESGIPVILNGSSGFYTTGVDNYFWRRNLTIRNVVSQTFTNVTANASLPLSVKGNVYLNVSWNGYWCDITPSSQSSDCDTSNPTYYQKSCGGDTFYVCKKDTNGNGVIDFFQWKQPSTSSTTYQTGGYTNSQPLLENSTVSPSSDTWGSEFNFSVDVYDDDGDAVNVTLYVMVNQIGWIRYETVTVYGNGTANFSATSSKYWTGSNQYLFEYFDFNSSNTSKIYHSSSNTSVFSGPTATKHQTGAVHIQGNNSVVNQSEPVLLKVRINDTTSGGYAANSSCAFWITTDGSNYILSFTNTTDQSGYCVYTFIPNSTYSAGLQKWKAGVYGDDYYLDSNSSEFFLTIQGKLYIKLLVPSLNQSFYRNSSNYMEAVLLDRFGSEVSLNGYNCTFYSENVEIGNSTTLSGHCNATWSPACSVDIGMRSVNVTLWGNGSDYYVIAGSVNATNILMKDNLTVSITSPSPDSLYHKNDTVSFGVDVNDTCLLAEPSDYTVTWYQGWVKKFRITVSELQGTERVNEPLIINGSELESLGFDLSNWRINYTRVWSNGWVPFEIKPWSDENKTVLNSSQIYFNQYSDLVILTNLSAWETKDYWVYLNESFSNPYTVYYLERSGFEDGSLAGWECNRNSNCNGNQYCNCTVSNQSLSGNYSLLLEAYGREVEDVVWVNRTIPNGSISYITILYKTENYGGTIITISDGTNTCELPDTFGSWENHTCSGFSQSTYLEIKLNQSGNSGAVSRVYVDRICPSDSSGNCLSIGSGGNRSRIITVRETISNPWHIPVGNEVGHIRIFSNASGDYYVSDEDSRYLYIFGWAYTHNISISSTYCTYNDTVYQCAQNASLHIYCDVRDANTSSGIIDYNVSFYNDGSYIGSALTNASGIAHYFWENSGVGTGSHQLECNITDEPGLFYNATDNRRTLGYEVESGNTTGYLLVVPLWSNATDINLSTNYTLHLNLTIVNNGSRTMYNPLVSYSEPPGIYATSASCPPIEPLDSCSRNVSVNVTYTASLYNQTLNITVDWTNADSTQGSAANSTVIYVNPNPYLRVLEEWVNYTIPVGVTRNIGNFTVENFGNVILQGINFSLSGGNASQLEEWITFSPSHISTLNKGNQSIVYVNLTIPLNATTGIYQTYLYSNSTGNQCSPPERCWDYLLLNISVTPQDWERYPGNLSKTVGIGSVNGTIGIITVTNNKNQTYSFQVSTYGNGTDYITVSDSSFSLSPYGTKYLYVYHNASSAPVNLYFANVTITSLNQTVPASLNTSVTLRVVNLTIRIDYPTTSSPVGPVNSSDYIGIRVNATFNDQPISSGMSWTVTVNGTSCQSLTSSYNSSYQYWNLNCSVPYLPLNPIYTDLTVTGNYTTEDMVVSDTQSSAVIYDDITPPRFSEISIAPKPYSSNSTFTSFTVTITDNAGVDSVWGTFTHNSGSYQITSQNYSQSGDIYTFNLSHPNIPGDYDITIYANDSSSLVNSTTAWFDIYKSVHFSGNFTNPVGENLTFTIKFYRPSTSLLIHSFSTNTSDAEFNWTLHQRVYDMKIEGYGHSFIFRNLDVNQSSEVRNPVSLDIFPNHTSSPLSAVNLPDEAQNPILGIVLEPNNITFDTVNFTLNYSTALQAALDAGISIQQDDLEIFLCSNWDYVNRECDGSSTFLDRDIDPVKSEQVFRFTAVPSSAYIIAESCYPNICGQAPPSTGGETPPSTTTGGGGTSYTPPVCGNGVCEESENSENCPEDCLEEVPFSIQTGIGDVRMYLGENKTYPFIITNKLSRQITVLLSVEGSIQEFVHPEETVITVPGDGKAETNIIVSVPETADPGTYTGTITAQSSGKKEIIPVTLRISQKGEALLSLIVDVITKTVEPSGNLRFSVEMRNIGFRERFNATVTYILRDADTEEIVYSENETLEIEQSLAYTKVIKVPDIPLGNYLLETYVEFDSKSVRDIETFEVMQPFFETLWGQVLIYSLLIISLTAGGYYGRKRYLSWKLSRARYIFPVDYSKIPGRRADAFWIGKIAETDRRAWLYPEDLTTHVLIAGSTGAGKSVGASVIVEEALENNIPVVVFDPTAQWTGFVKPCQDENLLRRYKEFGMDPRRARPYKGMIFEVTDPNLELDFKEYMNPGEVTVFTLDKLKPGEYDIAVKNIVDAIFRVGWEETTKLRMIVVFDEVHRLLERYGGKGGYVSLERAAREFRKWGIGLIMCSQVLADFKEAIAGNVLTDIQLNTKSLVDIGKVKAKYGEEYASRISREGVGVGMIQNPKYNDGKPYFVQFRPTWHNPHKITAEEMQQYKEFSQKLKILEEKIQKMKARGIDTYDRELELKLAKDKLKQGRFRMARIYIMTLEKNLE